MLGILPGLLGVIQATEAIKLILGIGEPLIGRLLLVDALGMRFRELKLRKNPECPVCGTHPTVTKLIDYEQFCGITPPAKETTQVANVQNGVPQIGPEELRRRQTAGEDVFVLDVREPHEYQIANIGGHLIPLNDLPKRVERAGPRKEHRGALQVRRTEPEGFGVSAAAGLSACGEPGGRDYGVVGQNRPIHTQVLGSAIQAEAPAARCSGVRFLWSLTSGFVRVPTFFHISTRCGAPKYTGTASDDIEAGG